MHRKEQLNKLVQQWLELELSTTCVRADSFTRVLVELKDSVKEIHITNRRMNKTVCIIGLFENTLAYTTGYDEKDEHTAISTAIWALETAVEQY